MLNYSNLEDILSMKFPLSFLDHHSNYIYQYNTVYDSFLNI